MSECKSIRGEGIRFEAAFLNPSESSVCACFVYTSRLSLVSLLSLSFPPLSWFIHNLILYLWKEKSLEWSGVEWSGVGSGGKE